MRPPQRSALFPYTTLFRSSTRTATSRTPFATPYVAPPIVPETCVPCPGRSARSEEHTSELQSRQYLVCRLLLEKKKNQHKRGLTTSADFESLHSNHVRHNS